MMNSFVLAKKDYASYFRGWMGLLTFALFFLIAGIFFSILVISYARVSLEAVKSTGESVRGLGLTRFVFGSFFMNMGTMLMFFIPLFSMRSFAEERKLHTLELIFTYPLSDFDIVWGKFLGMVWFLMALVLPSVLYVILLHGLGGELDWGPIAIGYLGFSLLGISYLALGLFVSSIAENQMVSAIVTFGCLLVFWVLEWISGLTDGPWAHFFSGVSPLNHYQEFTVGVLDGSNLAYFCFFTFYFLFLSLRSIETRNWKG